MRRLAQTKYDVQEVYVKPTEAAQKYHHPDCGRADGTNYERVEAERDGYSPGSCCLARIKSNRLKVVLTNRDIKRLHEAADQQDREMGEVASDILNSQLDPEKEESVAAQGKQTQSIIDIEELVSLFR